MNENEMKNILLLPSKKKKTNNIMYTSLFKNKIKISYFMSIKSENNS